MERYGGDEGCEYVGCTATIAYLWRDNGKRYLVVGNVGDSHAFICRKGKAVPLTEEHTLENEDERRRILDMGVELFPDQTRLCGLKVTRALGDLFAKQIES